LKERERRATCGVGHEILTGLGHTLICKWSDKNREILKAREMREERR